jgi:hypothetical protein
MSLTLDQLKEKAAQIEADEQNAEPTIDGTPAEPIQDLAPEPSPAEPAPAEEPKEGDPAPAEPELEEPAPLELDEEGNPIQQEFAFDPNIKVMDNEVAVPDFLAKAVTNEEEAKALTELFEKSYGLDAVKEKRDHFKTKSTEFETKYNETSKELTGINENLDFLDKLIQTNDMETFQKFAKIQDDQILQRAAQIIKYRDLTPTQKAEYDNNTQSRQRLYAQEMELNDLRQNQNSDEIERTQTELDSVISSEAYQQVATQFDARLGEGAFQREVIQRAMHMEQSSKGKTIWSPQQAVEETVRVLGLTQSQSPEPTEQPQQVTTPQPAAAPEQTIVVNKAKPTITKVDGGSKSPARPIVKSIDDLRKLAEQHSHG